MNITFRTLLPADFPHLEQIIQKTWNYEHYYGADVAPQLAKFYFSSCLVNFTFSQVALDNNKPIGVILATDKQQHRCPLSYRLRYLRTLLPLYLTSLGRAALNCHREIEGNFHQMLKQHPGNYQGQLSFFILDPQYQGKGLGKTLHLAALNYFKQNQLNEIYLFSDTYCNYRFYEHQGMNRIAQTALAPDEDNQQVGLFMYQQSLK